MSGDDERGDEESDELTHDHDDEISISTIEVGEAEFAIVSIPLADVGAVEELTDAERAVARLALDGKSNAEIAEFRDVSERTVANQLASIYRKLEVNSRAELAAWIIDHRD